jgi:hypothetical protein
MKADETAKAPEPRGKLDCFRRAIPMNKMEAGSLPRLARHALAAGLGADGEES